MNSTSSSPQWRRKGPPTTCSACGQPHLTAEPHIYDYVQEVDEDLLCQICLQPLVAPTDTKCGHTFCHACLGSYLQIQPLCPLDRTHLLMPADCQPASLMVRRLLDKLIVVCPNTPKCNCTLQRCDLEDHLRFRCPGAIVAVTPQILTPVVCGYQGPRRAVHRHQPSCGSHLPNPAAGVPRATVIEGELSTIEIWRSSPALGMRIVGGSDSPLRCIVLQEIYLDGIVAADGRLKPGDQLIEVNGDDLTRCTHMQACAALTKNATPSLVLTVYRDRTESYGGPATEEVYRFSFTKQTGQQLGIKLTAKRFESGVFISEVVDGGLADLDGRLQADDRLIEINAHDLRQARVEEASLLVQTSPRRVDITVARCSPGAAVGSTSTVISGSSPPVSSVCGGGASSSYPADSQDAASQRSTRRSPRPPPDRPMQPKYFTLIKTQDESLGISVAGGLREQHTDTPVYVTNIQPGGCMGRSKQIKKGDILLSVNGQSLLGITYPEAIGALKGAASVTSVTMGIIEGPETSLSPANFVPSWMYWQSLPRTLHMPKTVVLHRSATGSLGFSIVGGRDSVYGDQPIHILLVVHDSPAAREGKLKCGDQILSVNGHRLDSVRHTTAVAMLKQARLRVVLEVLSWPGTQL